MYFREVEVEDAGAKWGLEEQRLKRTKTRNPGSDTQGPKPFGCLLWSPDGARVTH